MGIIFKLFWGVAGMTLIGSLIYGYYDAPRVAAATVEPSWVQSAKFLPRLNSNSRAERELVFFWRGGDATCEAYKAMVEKIRSKVDRQSIRDVEYDAAGSDAGAYGVNRVPAFIYLENGKVVKKEDTMNEGIAVAWLKEFR